MDTPSRENHEIVQEISYQSQAAAPGTFLARLSIIAAVIVIVLNLAQVTILEGRSAILMLVQIIAMVVVLAGVISASAGLFRAWNCRDSNVIILATVGLLLNGSLLATGFVKPPIKGRLNEGAATGANAPTVSTRSGRTIVTQDWTAGFVVELTDASFDNAVNDPIVLVDFWASWCGPCREMSPIINELANDYQGRIRVCKLNVDSANDTAAKLGVRNIPTIVLYRNGRIYKKWVGVTDKSVIMLEINKLL
jgi:thioredoxin 1